MLSKTDSSKKKRDSRVVPKRYIMLLDSQPQLADQLVSILGDSSISIATTTQWKPALNLLVAKKIELIICDLELADNGALELFETVKTNHPKLLPSLLFSRNIVTRPEATFLNAGERRELLDRPFKHDQAIPLLTRRLTRIGIQHDAY